MSRSTAWTLDFGDGLTAVIGSGELAQVVSDPELFPVPHAPRHCSRAMVWQGRALPVMDLGRWLKGGEVSRGRLYAGIVAHENREQTEKALEFAALLLSAIPVQRTVDDDAACSLPPEPAAWREVAWSCFGEGDRLYPILALSHVFSGTLK